MKWELTRQAMTYCTEQNGSISQTASPPQCERIWPMLASGFILLFWLTLPLPPRARRNGKIFDRRPDGIWSLWRDLYWPEPLQCYYKKIKTENQMFVLRCLAILYTQTQAFYVNTHIHGAEKNNVLISAIIICVLMHYIINAINTASIKKSIKYSHPYQYW